MQSGTAGGGGEGEVATCSGRLGAPKGPFPGGQGGQMCRDRKGAAGTPPGEAEKQRRRRFAAAGLQQEHSNRAKVAPRRRRQRAGRRQQEIGRSDIQASGGAPRMGPSVVGQVASAWRRFCWVVADLSGQPLRASHSLRRVHECRGGSRFKPQICDGPRRHDEKKAEA